VRRHGRLVTNEDVERARAAGADDKERSRHRADREPPSACIRWKCVDGLATWTPLRVGEEAVYKRSASGWRRRGIPEPQPSMKPETFAKPLTDLLDETFEHVHRLLSGQGHVARRDPGRHVRRESIP
jgi:hypothetical protein